MMRYLFGFLSISALGLVPLVGCGDTAGAGGSGGSAGGGGTGGAMLCDADFDCDDANECTNELCDRTDGMCSYSNQPRNALCDCDLGGDEKRTECVCNGSGNCVECNENEQCDDFNDCTTDACDSASAACDEPAAVTDGTPCDGGTCLAGRCALSGSVLPCTEQGIRNAIAEGDGPYTFDCDRLTTVTTKAEIIIDNDVILDGEGNLRVDGDEDHRVFSVAEGVTVELHGFTVARGVVVLDEGGGILNAGDLMLMNSTVLANVARAQEVCGDFGCFLAAGYGGGIYNRGNLTLENSTVSGNTASEGGGVESRFGHLILLNSTVSGNIADSGGGISNGGTLVLTDSTVSGNIGGGITDSGPWVALTNSTVSGNSVAGDLGGGIFSRGGILQLTNSTVSRNIGGGIERADRDGSLIVRDSTVSGNIGYEEAGGIRSETDTFLVNSTVSGNSANSGIGISQTGGVLTLLNSTVSDHIHANTFAEVGDPPSFASIVTTATLVDGVCTQEGDEVTWTSGGYNVESPGDTCGFDEEGDQPSVLDPMLGPLQNNGGLTETHALLPGSPAINQIPEADCEVETDQRGVARPQGDGCDVGAVEIAVTP